MRDGQGRVAGYKEDAQGRVVTTRLEEGALALIAEATRGRYIPATAGGGEMDTISEAIGSMDQREMKQRLMTRYEERFQIPLALALVCLAGEILIPERRKRRAQALALGRAAAFVVAAALAFTPASAASARRLLQEGNRLYLEGKLDEALSLYTQAQSESPDAPEVHLSIGNVLFKKGDFEGAKEAYQKAKAARDGVMAENAHYNAGTASLAAGEALEAVEEFKKALTLDPEDHEARRNLELALRQLEQAQRQPQPDQQKPPDDEDKKKDQRQNSPENREGHQDQKSPASPEERTEKSEAERILDALRGLDRPHLEQGKERRPDKRPERDW